MTKTSVAIMGIGGVGGYLGARLALFYRNASEIAIIFIARGETLKEIELHGLELRGTAQINPAIPAIVSDDPDKIGHIDLLICCVKNYDIENALLRYKDCVDEDTIVISFLNGMESPEKIKKIFPQASVWAGCAYIVSTVVKPGVISVSSTVNRFYFGSEDAQGSVLGKVAGILNAAGIEAQGTKDAQQMLWEKFMFISPFATITSALDITVGTILHDEQKKQVLVDLMLEVQAVANASGIYFDKDIIQKRIDRLALLPPEATASMHNDFRKGNRTELYSLTRYVIELGEKFNIRTPVYQSMLTAIQIRWGA